MTRRWIALGGACAFGGIVAVLLGEMDDSTRLFNTGLVGIVLAGLAMTQHVNTNLNAKASIRLDELWATAYDEGFDAGARAAREQARPVVVPVDFRRADGRHKKASER